MTVSQDPYSGDQSSHASSVPTKAEASQVATASHSVQETLRPQSGRMRPGTGTARASPLEGLGRYRILKLLGQGAMGAVYLAEDTELQRQVALKVPKFVSPDAGDERERFYREARLAATLHHPNICPVYDIGEHQGTRYITMAYLVGPPLSQLVGTESLKAERTVAWVLRKIALALAEAHAKGVVHRDLKPGNILLDERHEPVVTDFGLAQRVGQSTDSRLTQRDALVGTPAYMAPEQISGDPARIGPACDTYALGVMLYEFLTGQLPYRGSITSVLGQILQGQPQRPCALRPDLDPELERICLKLMALTPAERYGSATEAAAVLTKWLEQVPATPARNASEEAPSTVDVAVVGKPAVGGADRSDVVRGSPTPHTAPTAGLPPAAPNLDAQRRLYDYRQQTIALLRQGQFAAVLDRLERMTRIFGPGTEPYIAWAQRELAKVKALPPLVLQKGPTLVAEGTRRLATQDFAGVIGLLEPLPAEYRSPEAEQLLQQARTLQAEVEQLNAHVQRAVRERRYDGLRPALQRLLQLEPGNLVARDLFERLGTYAPGEAWRFDEDGHLMPGRAHDRWLDRLARLLHYRLLRRRPTPASRAPSQWAEVKALPLPKDSLLSPGLFLALGLLLALFAGAYYAGTSFLETARVSSTVPTPSPSTDPTPKPEPKPEPKSATEPNTELRPEMPPVAVAPFDAKHAKQHQEAWAKHRGVPVVETNSIGMKLVLIPPGEFEMGSSEAERARAMKEAQNANDNWGLERIPGEGPQHRVRITQPFRLGMYEVTQDECERVMGRNPSEFSASGNGKNKVAGQDTSHHPVEHVSWDEATEFCRRLSALSEERAAGRVYRLPTEAQWEYACRAGTTTRWSCGDDERSFKQYGWVACGTPRPVGLKGANAWDLYDMHGNVWEWCMDWYDRGYFAASPTDDPPGPFGGSHRMHRGGSANTPARNCRSATRTHYEPGYRSGLGFRVACNWSDDQHPTTVRPDQLFRPIPDGTGQGRDAAGTTDSPSATAASPAMPAAKTSRETTVGNTAPTPPPPPGPPNLIYLDDLSETSFSVGYGTLGKHGAGVDGQVYRVNGKKVEHALFAHPKEKNISSVVYRLDKLPGKYTTFRATVVNDSSRTPLTFQVLGDGRTLWMTDPPMKVRGKKERCQVDIRNVRELELRIHCLGSAMSAWGWWVEPRLERQP